MITLLDMCQGKIVSLHINPLDAIVFRFFYTWKYRPGRENLYQSPRDIKQEQDVLRISYENMIMDPEITFGIVLNWLALPSHISKF